MTGYETTRLRDEEGDGELGNSEEHERELETLHGSCPDGSDGESERFWLGRNDGVGSKQASLSKRVAKKRKVWSSRGKFWWQNVRKEHERRWIDLTKKMVSSAAARLS